MFSYSPFSNASLSTGADRPPPQAFSVTSSFGHNHISSSFRPDMRYPKDLSTGEHLPYAQRSEYPTNTAQLSTTRPCQNYSRPHYDNDIESYQYAKNPQCSNFNFDRFEAESNNFQSPGANFHTFNTEANKRPDMRSSEFAGHYNPYSLSTESKFAMSVDRFWKYPRRLPESVSSSRSSRMSNNRASCSSAYSEHVQDSGLGSSFNTSREGSIDIQHSVSLRSSLSRDSRESSVSSGLVKPQSVMCTTADVYNRLCLSGNDQTSGSDCVALNSGVSLDTFNCDLFVTVSPDGLTAYDLASKGFQNMWGGIRATHGLVTGRAAFEVTLLDNLELEMDYEEEERSHGGSPHVTRVGWSQDFTDLSGLGEVLHSYGYGGTGKKSHNRKFYDYGVSFKMGDVLTCYLEKSENGEGEISFAVNGTYMGVAFVLQLGATDSHKPLFPHISSKNMKYTVNFGSHPLKFPLRPRFQMIDFCPNVQPAVKSGDYPEDYELIMLVGLPASGKTTYIEEFVKRHADKKYVVLGTNAIIEKMKVMNLCRKFNYHERWAKLFDRANEVLKTFMKFSERKLRNYIIDQTNVFPSARKRKKSFYKWYQCHCYVFVCTPEELELRTLKTGRENGKWVPIKAVMDMKKAFRLPNHDENWLSVSYIEEDEQTSQKLVEEYNKEALCFFNDKNKLSQLPENNEVPPPKYLRMIEDDPQGTKYQTCLKRRREMETVDTRSDANSKRNRLDSCGGSSTTDSEFQLQSRYASQKTNSSSCNPFKAHKAPPFPSRVAIFPKVEYNSAQCDASSTLDIYTNTSNCFDPVDASQLVRGFKSDQGSLYPPPEIPPMRERGPIREFGMHLPGVKIEPEFSNSYHSGEIDSSIPCRPTPQRFSLDINRKSFVSIDPPNVHSRADRHTVSGLVLPEKDDFGIKIEPNLNPRSTFSARDFDSF